MKHRVKAVAREVFARVLWHTGLARLVDRCSPPRLTILYGHCVADEALNGTLAPEMKISEARLERLLERLGERFEWVTIGEGMARLAAGDARRSMVALSMDDGYRDNLVRLVPLLQRTRARATVFLEAGPVVARRIGWLHTLDWLVARLGPAAVRDALIAWRGGGLGDGFGEDPRGREALLAAGDANALKRALKYHARQDLRDGVLLAIARNHGYDARAHVEQLYLDREGARALVASGVIEVGGHTIEHPVLSTQSAALQAREIAGGKEHLEAALGDSGAESAPLITFAYPYGRSWDFDGRSVEAVAAAGFRWAVTTHAGTNTARSAPFALRRWPIEESTALHLLGVEASGGFEWLRRRGIDLVE
ncbi:MAG: polysaccharide deacetylase family protein [Planctomycetota bacterium]